MKHYGMAVNKIKNELDRLLYIKDQMARRSRFECDSDRQFHYETLLEISNAIQGLQCALSLLED